MVIQVNNRNYNIYERIRILLRIDIPCETFQAMIPLRYPIQIMLIIYGGKYGSYHKPNYTFIPRKGVADVTPDCHQPIPI